MVNVSFDPNTKIIEVTDAPPANNIQTLDFLNDVYSEAKRQWLSDLTLRKHIFPIKAIGGDPITDVQNLGTTFFLLDDWKLRAYNQSGHTLRVIGNVSTQELDGSYDADSIKFDFVGGVQIENEVSNIVDSSVARLDLAQLLEAIYIDIANGVAGTDEGIGTPTNPVNNIADARVIADRENLRAFKLSGNITLDQSYEDWNFQGLTANINNVISLNGQSVDNSKFQDVVLDGTMSGIIECDHVGFQDVVDFDGVAFDSGVLSSIELAEGSFTVFTRCISGVAGNTKPLVSFNAGANPIGACNIRGWDGGIEVTNLNHVDEVVTIDMNSGRCKIASSCTAGEVVVGGVGSLDDQSAGATVIDYSLVDAEKLTRILDLMEADESITNTEAFKYLRGTTDVLLQKLVSGSGITGTITLTDPP